MTDAPENAVFPPVDQQEIDALFALVEEHKSANDILVEQKRKLDELQNRMQDSTSKLVKCAFNRERLIDQKLKGLVSTVPKAVRKRTGDRREKRKAHEAFLGRDIDHLTKYARTAEPLLNERNRLCEMRATESFKYAAKHVPSSFLYGYFGQAYVIITPEELEKLRADQQ